MNASRDVAEWFAIFEEDVVFVVNDKRPGCCCLVTLRANDIQCDEEEETCGIHFRALLKLEDQRRRILYVMAYLSGHCMQASFRHVIMPCRHANYFFVTRCPADDWHVTRPCSIGANSCSLQCGV